MAQRKTATDYRKDLQDLQQQQKALEARITKRFQTLCKQHPDVPLYQIVDSTNANKPVLSGWFTDESPVRVPTLTISVKLQYIELIEKHLESLHPHKQTAIEFPCEECPSKV